ncbi:hypothetical protein QTP88_017599 [Uroleucon formosanum]
MADGHTAITSGTTSLEARVGDLDIKFEATILDNLYYDALLGHDFLVNNEVPWDYAAYTIHMGRQIRTLTCWKGKSHPPATNPDLSKLEFGNDTETRVKLTEILNKYAIVFSDKVGRTKLIEHEIFLTDPSPIALKPYPYPQRKQAAIDDMVRDIENQGLVAPSTSPWAAPVVLGKKKYGTFRLCVDYRRLNDVTESDAYPMPDLNKMIRQMRSAKIFSIFDLRSGSKITGIGLVINKLRSKGGVVGKLAERVVLTWKNVVKAEKTENYISKKNLYKKKMESKLLVQGKIDSILKQMEENDRCEDILDEKEFKNKMRNINIKIRKAVLKTTKKKNWKKKSRK